MPEPLRDAMLNDAGRVSAQTLDRGLQVLETVADAPHPISTAELADILRIHRTVVHRLAGRLAARGYLHREGSGRYRLGPTCFALASGVSDLRTVARPLLEDLVRRTEETVHLVILAGHDVVFVDGIESPHPLRVTSRTGRRVPAHSTSVGKSWLATLDTERLRRLYPDEDLPPFTSNTIRSRTALERALDVIRRDGYAISRAESEAGVGSVSAAVCDNAGQARAAISVAAPLNRLTDDARSSIARELLTTVRDLGLLLS